MKFKQFASWIEEKSMDFNPACIYENNHLLLGKNKRISFYKFDSRDDTDSGRVYRLSCKIKTLRGDVLDEYVEKKFEKNIAHSRADHSIYYDDLLPILRQKIRDTVY